MTDTSYLSTKPIPSRERLIFALDVPNEREAYRVLDKLGDAVHFYKLGLELFMSGSYFNLVKELVQREKKKVFVDLKFFDVPETVGRAVRCLRDVGATFATVHPSSDELLRTVAREKGELKILAVTVLTSLSQDDMNDLGFQADIKDIVLSRARRSLELGCDGVISSGLEAQLLRQTLAESILIVSPGIRPGTNKSASVDDQKRVATVEEAFCKGADYIVVGRPIRDATNPRQMAEEYQAQIAEVFAGVQAA